MQLGPCRVVDLRRKLHGSCCLRLDQVSVMCINNCKKTRAPVLACVPACVRGCVYVRVSVRVRVRARMRAYVCVCARMRVRTYAT